MTDLISLLLRRSEAETPACLPGSLARRHFGPAFDRLVQSRVIEEIAPLEAWAVCATCECPLDARPIRRGPDGRLEAPCPLEAADTVVLHDDDVRRFRVHDAPLVRGLSGGAAAETVPGLWLLDRRIGGRRVFVALRRAVVGMQGLAAAIGTSSREPAVLIGPKPPPAAALRLQEANIVVVPASEAITMDSHGDVVIDESVVVAAFGTSGVRVTVLHGRTILVDGVEKKIPANALRLLKLLVAAWRRGEAVSKTTVEEEFGRQPAELISELRGALSAGHPEAGSIRNWITVEKRPTSYRLTLRKDEIAIFD